MTVSLPAVRSAQRPHADPSLILTLAARVLIAFCICEAFCLARLFFVALRGCHIGGVTLAGHRPSKVNRYVASPVTLTGESGVCGTSHVARQAATAARSQRSEHRRRF